MLLDKRVTFCWYFLYCLVIGLLVYSLKFGLIESLAIIPSQLSSQQWRFCKLPNAKCLGSEGMWDDFF